jgi:hypothetical protein
MTICTTAIDEAIEKKENVSAALCGRATYNATKIDILMMGL